MVSNLYLSEQLAKMRNAEDLRAVEQRRIVRLARQRRKSDQRERGRGLSQRSWLHRVVARVIYPRASPAAR